MKILLAEDSDTSRDLLAQLLETERHEVVCAKDGSEALTLLGSAKPDVVVLDYIMPYLDGLEVVRRMRSRDDARGIPVVIATAVEADLVEKLRGDVSLLGNVTVVRKPVAPEELFRLLGEISKKG